MEGFPSGDDGSGVWMSMASANALAVAVRAGMRGELEWSARLYGACSLEDRGYRRATSVERSIALRTTKNRKPIRPV